MRILLLGATGRLGNLILDILLETEFEICVLVRDKLKINKRSGKLSILEGDTTSEETLKMAMMGCQAVVSALNISRTSDFPWARLRTPSTFLSETMGCVIKTAIHFSVKKIVICSAWGVRETKQDIPGWFKWLINNSNIGVAYKDHERQENLLRNSGINFTIVRPVGLINSKKEQKILVGLDNSIKPNLVINRISVARFMVDQLTSNEFSGRAVTISKVN